MPLNMEELLQDTVLLQCRVNGQRVEAEIAPGTSLLDFLRDERRLTGTRMGCMTGHCGACTVLIDGRTAKACITPAASAQRKTVVTIEGIGDAHGTLNAVQQAFWDESGFQCGYCAAGMVLTVVELLNENPDPGDAEIRRAIAGNLCRCTGYQSIVRAARRAAARVRGCDAA
jgi:aerobic carbon-monoxide dehydrogenase small subunit